MPWRRPIPAAPPTLSLHGGRADLVGRSVVVDGRSSTLSPTEASLLGYLAAHPGRDVPRDELLEEVWGYRQGVVSRTLDTAMGRLRKKVEQDPRKPAHLLTVAGVGYRFVPLASAAASVPETGSHDVDAFFGRERELAQLDALHAEGARLITILGPGGMGKTRLGSTWVRRQGGEVVELASLADAGGMLERVAAQLGARGGDPASTIATILENRGFPPLLLDNLEQILPGALEPVGQLLAQPGVRLLVTTRDRLRIAGEVCLELGPLDETAARALFEARAPRGGSAVDAEALGELLQGLDRVPLAIELAAARAGLLGPVELLERLSRPLDVLSGRRGDGRHSSLRQAIAWSWDLLGPRERRALRALCAFAGPAPVAALEAVLGDEGLELVQELRDRSWLRAWPSGPGGLPRMGLLPPMRQFIEEALSPDPDAARRHARWYARSGEDGHRRGLDRELGLGRRRLEAELDEVLAAHAWAIEAGSPALAVPLALAAYEGGRLGRPAKGLLPVLDATLALPGLESGQRARLLESQGALLRAAGKLSQAVSASKEAADEARRAGLLRTESNARCNLGACYQERDELEAALKVFERALDQAVDAEAEDVEAAIHGCRGNALKAQGLLREARVAYREAIDLHRDLDNRRMQGVTLGNLALVWHDLGQLADARVCMEEALAAHAAVGNRRYEGLMRANLGILHADEGDLPAAVEALEGAIAVDQEVGSIRWEGHALYCLAEVRRLQGQAELAESLSRRAARLARRSRWRALSAATDALLGDLLAHRGAQAEGAERIETALQTLTGLGHPLEAAIVRCRLGRAHLLGEDPEAAQRELAGAREVATTHGVQPSSELGRALAELERLLS